jgi:lipopolysaccharide export LptBFGC system permease protein LptF
MPIIWKVLLKKFFFAFFLCFLLFIFLSIAGNIQSILAIAKFGSGYQTIFLVYLSNLLEMSGMCFGFCCLLGSFYATSQLNLSGQISFLLPFGIRSIDIQKPLLQASLLLSFLSFTFISEILPYVKTQIFSSPKEIAVNPLTLLSNYKLSGFYESFVDMELDETGKTASDFILIQNNSILNGLLFFKAKEISISPEGKLNAIQANIICHPPGVHESSLRHTLLIENADSMSIDLQELTPTFSLTYKMDKNLEFLPLSMLFNINSTSIGIELLRRSSLAFFPFSLTLIGGAVGQKCRKKSIKSSILLLIALFFFSTILLQSTNNTSELHWKILLYILPHLFLWYLTKINISLFKGASNLS